jgi:uncharacterized protein
MSFELLVLVFGAFAASLAAGASGFAFGLVGMAIWLHAIPPSRAVPLVILCSTLLNLALIWRLRSSVDRARLAPFLLGALAGVPLGVAALAIRGPGADPPDGRCTAHHVQRCTCWPRRAYRC